MCLQHTIIFDPEKIGGRLGREGGREAGREGGMEGGRDGGRGEGGMTVTHILIGMFNLVFFIETFYS